MTDIEEEVQLDDAELGDITQSGDDVLTEIKATIRKRYGISTEYPRPKRQPPDLSVLEEDDVGHNVAALTNDELANLLSEYTAFTCWLGQEVADAESARRLLEGNINRVKSMIALKLQHRRVPQTHIPAQVGGHSLVVALTLAFDRERAFEEILTARYKAYSKSTNLLSRIVTIRTGIDEGGTTSRTSPHNVRFAKAAGKQGSRASR